MPIDVSLVGVPDKYIRTFECTFKRCGVSFEVDRRSPEYVNNYVTCPDCGNGDCIETCPMCGGYLDNDMRCRKCKEAV